MTERDFIACRRDIDAVKKHVSNLEAVMAGVVPLRPPRHHSGLGNGQIQRVDAIRAAVAKEFGLSPSDMDGASRKACLSWPRQVAMALIREFTALSFEQIGKLFSKKSHCIVIHAVKAVRERSETEPKQAKFLDQLRAKLRETLLDC